ncbi:hypothetical protein AAG570_009160 [Ranatra chinensis]|uniref:Integrase zinc-binding domain-containing protein n=1 Tax=Ranatra chinensis TaxID=642074 RepID=A0ABD0YV46_9HEMI
MEEIALSEDLDTLAQEPQANPELPTLRVNPQLQLKSLTVGCDPTSLNRSLVFKTSTEIARPYIPKAQRVVTFPRIHDTSRLGIRATPRLIAQRYFWPSMNADVAQWTHACIPCQRSKVYRLKPGTRCPQRAAIHRDLQPIRHHYRAIRTQPQTHPSVQAKITPHAVDALSEFAGGQTSKRAS